MLYKIKQQKTSRYVCFYQYSIHLQIETYLIPFRKLPSFSKKVTEFLKADKFKPPVYVLWNVVNRVVE